MARRLEPWNSRMTWMVRITVIAYIALVIIGFASTGGFGFFGRYFLLIPGGYLALNLLMTTPYQRRQLIGLRPPHKRSRSPYLARDRSGAG
jgi:hypothetical protein